MKVNDELPPDLVEEAARTVVIPISGASFRLTFAGLLAPAETGGGPGGHCQPCAV
jgi:hypothetical protein